MKAVQRNMDFNGKTRPTSTEGFASPKAKGNLKEAEGIIKGDSTKAGEAVIQGNKIPAAKSPKK
jgi:hypothetical protein